ncbi:MAG: hypothetical protein U1F37_17565 [Alphaproteobacteria bacterium]
MSNQRPPGLDDPTQDPEQVRAGAGARGPAAQPWVDPNRTQRYSGRRSIADRLKDQSREPERPVTEETAPPPRPAGPVRPPLASSAQKRAAVGGRSRGAGRIFVVLAAVVVAGLAGGAAAAWFSGWRPDFLGAPASPPAKAPADAPAKPADAKPEAKPGEPAPPAPPAAPAPPTPPSAAEIPRSCYTGTTDVKAGAAACGFALDAAGALSFQGARLAERLAAGNAPAQRVVLYPMAPSGRFVFLRACEASTGGRCDVQRLADTREKKLLEVKAGDGFAWVVWSPKESMALLGWRDHLSDTIAVVATADGKSIRPSTIRTARNRYAVVRLGSVRWRDETSFSVDVKLCPPGRNLSRNADCEKDDDVKFRRRTVKIER